MSRLMSVAFTEQAGRERRKTVTRRVGWWLDKRGRRILQPGDRITLCRKVMGRKPGEPLVRICDVEVVSVRRERLFDGIIVEGAPFMSGPARWPAPFSGDDLDFRDKQQPCIPARTAVTFAPAVG